MIEVLEDILEAVLFASEAPLSVQRLRNLFLEESQPSAEEINAALGILIERSQSRPVQLVKVGNGYRYQTSADYAMWINKLYESKPPKLSRALLETLSIIAYQQPVTRGDIQAVRGVSVSSDIMHRLQERGWVKNIGHKEVPGRPSLYGTTVEFLSYFNLKTLKDLPELKAPRELQDIAKEMNLELPLGDNWRDDMGKAGIEIKTDDTRSEVTSNKTEEQHNETAKPEE